MENHRGWRRNHAWCAAPLCGMVHFQKGNILKLHSGLLLCYSHFSASIRNVLLKHCTNVSARPPRQRRNLLPTYCGTTLPRGQRRLWPPCKRMTHIICIASFLGLLCPNCLCVHARCTLGLRED